jgi:signal transduction histidine kinase
LRTDPIEGAIAVSAAPGLSAVQLPWLAPGVAALAALARPQQPAAWITVRADPSAVLLIVRQSAEPLPTIPPIDRLAPAALARVLTMLGQEPCGILDRTNPSVQPVLATAQDCAAIAHDLATRSRQADPQAAWVAGLLAPVGWLAIAAVRPDALSECLADDALAREPNAVQRRHWGMTAAQIARRLARRWELPPWLTAIVGHLDVPVTLAAALGADPALLAIVQAAVALATNRRDAPRFVLGTSLEEALGRLDVESNSIALAIPSELGDGNPYTTPWLRDLLELSLESTNRTAASLVPRLEQDVDDLQRVLLDVQAGEAERVQRQKLSALAEFAAGASHEINNPLAVISGQAQYLLGQEADESRLKSLRTVVQQAQRIHQILTDLMQFARPVRPQKRALDARDLVLGVAGTLEDLAAPRQVRIEVVLPDEVCLADADAKQLHTALACLLRNAVEAAPAEGWARLRLEVSAEQLRIVVEDNGPGPAHAQTEHLFDPFYSGRPAGRGRGLGLPTAWRLAREQGGDVWYEPQPDGVTRFVLGLPRLATVSLPQTNQRLSA